MSKVTQWFPNHVKPVHVGVYEVAKKDGGYVPSPYYFWDGEKWTAECSESPYDNCFNDPCLTESIFMSAYKCKWRGLANKPKVK